MSCKPVSINKQQTELNNNNQDKTLSNNANKSSNVNNIKKKIDWKIGDKIEFYSNSLKKWIAGEIIDTTISERKGLLLLVEGQIGDNIKQKHISPNSPFIREYNIYNHLNDRTCICGAKLELLKTQNCYPDEINEIKDKLTVDEFKKASLVSCDICGCELYYDDECFNCPKRKSDIHWGGYNLCISCVVM